MSLRRIATANPTSRQAQRGAATLIVVMVLFFVVSLVAAYASRNVIFEQRTAVNYSRSTQAQEVAEAGIRWAVSLLNAGRIGEDCEASTDLSDNSFRERYLDITPANGAIAPRSFGSPPAPLTAVCVWNPDASSWNCHCPRAAAAAVTPPTTLAVAPAFQVQFFPSSAGTVTLRVGACTRYSPGCIATASLPDSLGELGQGRALAQVVLYMAGQSISLPRAALTAGGDVNVYGLVVSNSRVGDPGLTIHAAGRVTGSFDANTQAGNALEPSQTYLGEQTALQPVDLDGVQPVVARDRFAALLFGMPSSAVRDQPNTVRLSCGGTCSGDEIRAAALLHPGRPLWVEGGADISTTLAGPIGSETHPVLLIVDGDLSISASGTTINGLVYVRPADPGAGWTLPSQGRVVGAVVVDSGVVGTSAFSIEYHGEMLQRLRTLAGSFVIVPGGWRDSVPL